MSGMGRQLLYIDPKELQGQMYTRPGQHILVVGASGAGKTSTLFKVIYNLWKQGETVIWRDDANLEFLSLVKVVPIKLFIPQGCRLHFEHKNVEKYYYDPFKKINEIFEHFDNEKLNVLLFDLYTIDAEVTIKFWITFFRQLYRYKRLRLQESWTLAVDELNDIAPGTRRGVIKDQIRLSSNLYMSAKKYRKMKLRLVGSTHNYNDLHAPLRGQFNYYIFKSMRQDQVPDRFWNYATKIEGMKESECLIVDRAGHHQFISNWTETTRWHLDPNKMIKLKPKTFEIPWDGEVRPPPKIGPTKRAQMWKLRTMICLRAVIDLFADQGIEFTYRDVAAMLDLSRTSGHRFFEETMSVPRNAWEGRLERANLSASEYMQIQGQLGRGREGSEELTIEPEE